MIIWRRVFAPGFELWKDDLPFDLEADDSLSECLSSLSMREEEYDHMGLTASPVNLPDLWEHTAGPDLNITAAVSLTT